jgi:hypothetical protein
MRPLEPSVVCGVWKMSAGAHPRAAREVALALALTCGFARAPRARLSVCASTTSWTCVCASMRLHVLVLVLVLGRKNRLCWRNRLWSIAENITKQRQDLLLQPRSCAKKPCACCAAQQQVAETSGWSVQTRDVRQSLRVSLAQVLKGDSCESTRYFSMQNIINYAALALGMDAPNVSGEGWDEMMAG